MNKQLFNKILKKTKETSSNTENTKKEDKK